MGEPHDAQDESDDRYHPPEVWEYGSIEEISEGFGGDPTDAESGSQA